MTGLCTLNCKRNEDNTVFVTTDGQTISPDGSDGVPVILLNKTGHPLS